MSRSEAEYRIVPAAPPTRGRWIGGLLVGTVLWVIALVVAHAFPVVVLGRDLAGTTFAIVAVLFAPLAFGGVALGLQVARCRLSDAGFVLREVRADLLIGVAVAAAWAALQFGVIIPLTGGADRADIVVNAEQIGSTWSGLAALILLAWGGGFAEEAFFRGHLMTTLRGVLGTSSWASVLVVAIPTLLFAMLHGYQGGWVGMFDTGVYGGAALSVLFLWRGRLLPCVVAHAAWNTIAAVIIFAWY